MKIEDALNLMGRNPAVDFPWEEALIGLVNSFLNADAQLDPRTATAMEIKSALSTLDAVTQQMVLLTSVGGQVSLTSDLPVPNAGQKTDKTRRHFATFMGFGGTVCVIALILASGVGNGVNTEAVVEVTKLIVEIMKMLSPIPAT
jgi:pyridoxal/pyridoxine/pyridoxamine kinase